MEFLQETDDLVVEYLIFRGFVDTARELFTERKEDRLHGMNAERVARRLLDLTESLQLREFLGLWEFLERRCFVDLGPDLMETASRLKSGLLKMFMVESKRRERIDRLAECLELLSVESSTQKHGFSGPSMDWRQWYSLPYCPNPADDYTFAPFFAEEWPQLFSYSLINFLGQVFRNQHAPQILAFPMHRNKQRALEADLRSSEFECARLREEVERLKTMISNRELAASHLGPLKNRPTSPPQEAKALRRKSSTEEQQQQQNEGKGGVDTSHMKLRGSGKHSGRVNRCRFSPDGSCLATASSDATVRIWRWDLDGQPNKNCLEQDQMLFCPSAALSLDWHSEESHLVAIGTSSNIVKLYDCNRRCESNEIIISAEQHLPFVSDVRFCSRTQLLATTSVGQSNYTVSSAGIGRVTNVPSPRSSAASGRQVNYYKGPVHRRSMLRLFNISTCQLYKSFDSDEYQITSVVFNHNGSLLITGANDGQVRVFDVLKTSCIMNWETSTEKHPLVRVSLTSDETTVITLDLLGEVSFWSLHKGAKKLSSFPSLMMTTTKENTVVEQFDSFHGDVASYPDHSDQFLISSPWYGDSVQWIDTTKQSTEAISLQPYIPNHGLITSIDATQLMPHHALIAACTTDNHVKLVEHQTVA